MCSNGKTRSISPKRKEDSTGNLFHVDKKSNFSSQQMFKFMEKYTTSLMEIQEKYHRYDQGTRSHNHITSLHKRSQMIREIHTENLFAQGKSVVTQKQKKQHIVSVCWQPLKTDEDCPTPPPNEPPRALKVVKKSNFNHLLSYDPELKSRLFIPSLGSRSALLKKVTTAPKFNYYVAPGNNAELVKRIMRDRSAIWCEVNSSSLIIHFKWKQNFQGIKYDRMIREGFYLKEMVNYFEHHKEITSKVGLVRSLQKHYNYQMTVPFSILPIVFMVNFEERNWDLDIASFVDYYLANRPSKLNNNSCFRDTLDLNFYKQKSYISPYKFGVNPEQSEQQRYLSYVKLQDVFTTEDTYLWLLKPADWNRGDGVHVFSNLEQLEALLLKYYSGWYLQQVQQNHLNPTDSPGEDKFKGVFYKCRQFVIQKYLERPFLMWSRKFDIRVWVLMSHDMQFFLFREGYIRTSSNEFDLKNEDPLIHLTNNAIQKHSEGYGQFESGNQLSFQDVQDYLDKSEDDIKHNFRGEVVPSIKEQIQISLYSIRKSLNKNQRKYCFQIFGYDFMIDVNFKVWLIEVNTNPCIEESSPLLQMLIPRMINDAFKISLDVIFPLKVEEQQQPLEIQSESTPINYAKYIERQGNGVYPVANYQDSINMWESIGQY